MLIQQLEGKLTEKILDDLPRSQWWNIALSNEKAMAELEAMKQQYEESKKRLENRFLDKVEKLQRGDELPPGVMKMVKVFVAVKRSCSRVTRWLAVTATRVSFPRSSRSRTCPISRTARRSISC